MGSLMLRSDYSLPLCVVAASGPFLYHPKNLYYMHVYCTLCVHQRDCPFCIYHTVQNKMFDIEPRQGKVRVRFSPSPLVLGGF